MKTNANLKRAARRRSGWFLYLSSERKHGRTLEKMRQQCRTMERAAAAALARLAAE